MEVLCLKEIPVVRNNRLIKLYNKGYDYYRHSSYEKEIAIIKELYLQSNGYNTILVKMPQNIGNKDGDYVIFYKK